MTPHQQKLHTLTDLVRKTIHGEDYVPELEFGCRVKVQLDEEESVIKTIQYINETETELGLLVECDEYEIGVIDAVEYMTPLGKPLSTRELLWALYKNRNFRTGEDEWMEGEFNQYLDGTFKLRVKTDMSEIEIPLDLEVSDYPEDLLEQLINLIKS